MAAILVVVSASTLFSAMDPYRGLLVLVLVAGDWLLMVFVAIWLGMTRTASRVPPALLSLLMTVGLTQVMNHVTSAVIMTPVALSFAQEMDIGDRPFLMAVLLGANFCFLSPVAHQANAMVMGPGDYRYMDFLRVGTPLTAILCAVAIVLLPYA